MDTVMAFAGFMRVGVRGHILIKDSAFFWPLSKLLDALGGIPVDRTAAGGVVGQMVTEFESRETFTLALVPEGTRKGVAQLKTGFWHIARAADVPIVCWYLDTAQKRTRWVGALHPTDSLEADLETIAQLYAAAGFTLPGRGPKG
jgi:1-acyl-sn-glycerol-3-phosphate acyltransferase